MTPNDRWPGPDEITQMADLELVTVYAAAAAIADRLDVPATRQNRAADCLAAVYRELRRRGPDAQAALLPLVTDPNPGVRLWAAVHALEFDPARGEPVVAEAARSDPSLRGFSAQITLREWKAGRLRFP